MITKRIKLPTDNFIKTPEAIPTKVPLNPYNPSLMSLRSYPEKYAVNVLTMLPQTASIPICHEPRNIPISINNPDSALFWNITWPIPRPRMSNELYIETIYIYLLQIPMFGKSTIYFWEQQNK